MSDRRLIIVRHAHRDTSQGRSLDNSLSKKGWEQAASVAKDLSSKLKGKKFVLISSPKKRCRETLQELAVALDCKIKISRLLDERDEDLETGSAFRKRIKKFVRWWENSKSSITVICSHGDWIPELTSMIQGEGLDLRKGEWVELELNS